MTNEVFSWVCVLIPDHLFKWAVFTATAQTLGVTAANKTSRPWGGSHRGVIVHLPGKQVHPTYTDLASAWDAKIPEVPQLCKCIEEGKVAACSFEGDNVELYYQSCSY